MQMQEIIDQTNAACEGHMSLAEYRHAIISFLSGQHKGLNEKLKFTILDLALTDAYDKLINAQTPEQDRADEIIKFLIEQGVKTTQFRVRNLAEANDAVIAAYFASHLGLFLDQMAQEEPQTTDFELQPQMEKVFYGAAEVGRAGVLKIVLDTAKARGIQIEPAHLAHGIRLLVRNKYEDDMPDIMACLTVLEQTPGFDVNMRDASERTPLTYAKLAPVARWLLERGADPMAHNQATPRPAYVLFVAWMESARPDTLAVLLEYGATLDSGPAWDEIQEQHKADPNDQANNVLFSAWTRRRLMEHQALCVEHKAPTSKSGRPKI